MAEEIKITEEIEVNKSFNLLTTAFQEHALGQINFARYSVIYARGFSEDLIDILGNVKTSYLRRLDYKKKQLAIKKNGRELWILVTANNKLYGDILNKIVKFFIGRLKNAQLNRTDFVVIGRQGKRMIDSAQLNINYTYYEIPDTNVTSETLKKLSDRLSAYDTVYMFFARFENLITQNPVQVVISGNIPDLEKKDKETIRKQLYLVEPGLDEIMKFFENQILSLVFNQIIQEAQLARYASRITAMENAQINIKNQHDNLVSLELKIRKANEGKKQAELLAGRRLWMKGA